MNALHLITILLLSYLLLVIETPLGAQVNEYDSNSRLTNWTQISGNAGIYTYDTAGNLESFSLQTPANGGPKLISASVIDARVGEVFLSAVETSEPSSSFSSTNLPVGLVINANTGTLTGIPTTSGVFPVTVTITSGGESNDVTLVIHIRPASTAPVVLRDPESSDVSLGRSITLSPDIDGSSPMTYQWKKNGTPIPGATTLSYTIPAMTAGDAGNYTLTATNSAGSDTSAAATLSVNQPLAINGGSGGLPISFTGSPAWYSQTSTTWDGAAALQSGAIGANGTTSFETTVTGPGVFLWRWKVSSQKDADGIVFYLDNVSQRVISGEVDWNQTGVLVEPGTHTLKWSYVKNFGTNTGQDAGWVADAYFIEGWLLNADEVGAGTINQSPDTEALYANGTTVTVTAVPESGYYFSSWADDLSGSTNPTTITMNAHKTVTAIFKEDLGVALGATGSQWITDGNADWFSQLFVSINDGIAAESGAIGNNQSTWVETTVTGPGTLSWWWKVSSESGYDKLTLTFNGVAQANISGEVDWVKETLTLPAGTQTLRWTYSKDSNSTGGQDTAWLDAVQFLPEGVQTFSEWVATWNLPIGFDGKEDDANGDGIANILAFAFGVPPLEDARYRLPTLSMDANTVSLTYYKSKKATGILWTPQVSDSLSSWTTEGISNVKISETSEIETWRATVSRVNEPKLFLWIVVE